jgi:hypothetical protein
MSDYDGCVTRIDAIRDSLRCPGPLLAVNYVRVNGERASAGDRHELSHAMRGGSSTHTWGRNVYSFFVLIVRLGVCLPTRDGQANVPTCAIDEGPNADENDPTDAAF